MPLTWSLAMIRPRLALLLVLPCVLLACGPAQRQQVLVKFLDDAPTRAGTDWCTGRGIEQEASTTSRTYFTQQFLVHRWRGEPPDSAAPIPESDVLTALDDSRLGLTLLVAPPGQGKTRFAEAIEARLCGTMPILRLDVAGEFPTRAAKGGEDLVPDQLARQLKLPVGDNQREFRDLLDGARWVLVVDSMHEVPEGQRPVVLRALRQFVERHPRRLQIVVLARTDMLQVPDAMLPFDTVLEIPPLDCAKADAYVQTLVGARTTQFWQAVQRFGLDARKTDANVCTYRHLTSFRSVRVMTEVVRTLGLEADAARLAAALQGPRAPVVEKLVAGLVEHDLAPLRIVPAQGVQLVEAMVASLSTAVLASDIPFTHAACQAVASGKVGQPVEACRRLLDSPLFVHAPGHERLAGPPLDGWVRARALAKRIDTSGCASMPGSALVLATPDTAGMLVGMPQGGRCLAEIALTLCTAPGSVDGAVRELTAGLPQGTARTQRLAGVKAEGCALQVLDKLR
jgi:hypothetical protein